MTHLVRKLWQINPLAELDGNKMHIRCLAHVIHLAAMELLVKIKVIQDGDKKAGDIDVAADLTEEEAESLDYEGGPGGEPDDNTSSLTEAKLGVVVRKVLSCDSF